MADQGSAVNKSLGNARGGNKKNENDESTGKQRTKRTQPTKSRSGHHAKLRQRPQESPAGDATVPPAPGTVPIYRAGLMAPLRSQQNANSSLPPGAVTFGPPPQFYPADGNSFPNSNQHQPPYQIQMQFSGQQSQDGNGFPVMPPPPSPRPNYGQQAFGLNGFNPFLLAGMKNIRDGDIENMLFEHWNSQMVLAAWSPNRQMTSTPENDVFVRSFVEPPWSDTGNVIFFCEGGKVVRCHAVLLQGILPKFTNELLEMTKFPYSAYVKELPYIPIFVKGIDQRCIEHLINLIYRGLDMLTGKEAFKLIQVLNVLNIYELSICIAPAPTENPDGGWNENYDDRVSAPPGNQRPPQSGRVPPPPSFDFGLANNATENSVEKGDSKSASHEEAECESQDRVVSSQDEPPQDPLALALMQRKGKKDTNVTIPISQGSLHSGQQSKDTDFAEGEETTPATSQQTSSFASHSQRSTDPIDKQRGKLLTAHPSENVANIGSSTSFPSLPLIIDKRPGTTVPVVNSNAGEQTKTDYSKSLSGRRRSFRTKTERAATKRLRQISENNGSPSDGDDEDVEEDESDMKRKKRTIYPKGMKEKALELLNEGRIVKDVANTLQVPGKLISRWKYEAKKSDDPPNSSFASGTDEAKTRNIIVGTLNSDESGRLRENFGQNVGGDPSIMSGFGVYIKEEDPMNLI